MQSRCAQAFVYISKKDTREDLIDYYAKYIALVIEKEANNISEKKSINEAAIHLNI